MQMGVQPTLSKYAQHDDDNRNDNPLQQQYSSVTHMMPWLHSPVFPLLPVELAPQKPPA